MNFFLIIFLLFPFFSFSQNANFDEIDNASKTIKYNGNLPELVQKLTSNYSDDVSKTKAIYFWITENISYDYRLFNRDKKLVKFKCKTKIDCEIKKYQFETEYIDKVLNKKKAICSGYSKLFKRMCDLAGIHAVEIEGYIKNSPYQIGSMGILDHAWNAVYIDGKTYFLDLTWASGYCKKGKNGKLNEFVKHRNDFYWFTPIEKFSVDHFPKDSKKIIDFSVLKDDYKNRPYIENSIIPNIEIISLKNGIVKIKKLDTLKFEFKYSGKIDKIQINTNLKRNPKIWYYNNKNEKIFNERALKKQEYIDYKKDGEIFSFNYIVTDENLTYIEILFDYDLKLKYKIFVEK